MCGYLKVLPMFLMVFPGMISRVLYPGQTLTSQVTPSNLVSTAQRIQKQRKKNTTHIRANKHSTKEEHLVLTQTIPAKEEKQKIG